MADLEVAVTDQAGSELLGNLFLTVSHVESGVAFRELRYSRRRHAYRFPAVPPGEVAVEARAAGYEPAVARPVLKAGRTAAVSLSLTPAPPRRPLVLDLGRRGQDAVGGQESPGPPRDIRPAAGTSLAAELFASFVADRQLRSAVVARPGQLTVAPAVGRQVVVDVDRMWRAAWHVDAIARQREVLIHNRLRYFSTLQCVFDNPVVRARVIDVASAEVAAHLVRVLGTLDDPCLDDVLSLAVAAQLPALATVERFARATIDLFGVRVPDEWRPLWEPVGSSTGDEAGVGGVTAAGDLPAGTVEVPPGGGEIGPRWSTPAEWEARPSLHRLAQLLAALAEPSGASGGAAPTSAVPDAGVSAGRRAKRDADAAGARPAHLPHTMTILPTYGCTAACENCCFGSHPGITETIPLSRLLGYVDQAAALGSVRLLVFSGGECFRLGNDLVIAVARATVRGLRTRCVTNGYWASTPERAYARLEPLRRAGLDELNVSTGDYHQRFVPPASVVNAAVAAVGLGVTTVVVVEATEGRAFTSAHFLGDPRIRELLADPDVQGRFKLIESPWMSMDEDDPIAQPASRRVNRYNLHLRPGCESVLGTMVVTPQEKLGACCGLTREQIPELHVGSLRAEPLDALADRAAADFLKIWLAVEGPEHILAWAASKDPSIDWEDRYSHHCDACRAMYHDPKVRAVIGAHYQERVADVLSQFSLLHDHQVAT